MKILKYALILAISLPLLLASPAKAAHGDPDFLAILSTNQYSNVAVTGDALFVVRYAMLYTVVPTTPINESTVGRLIDVGGSGALGTVNITSQSPIPDLGYSHGVFSFYFTVAPTPTGVLTAEISPNPSDTPPSSLVATKTSFSIKSRVTLAPDIRILASDFESIWQENIIDFQTGSGKLTLAGASYFNAAIPNLNSYAPDIFILGSISVDPTLFRDPVDYTYSDGLSAIWNGTPVGSAFITVSSQMGIPRKMLELIVVLSFNIFFGALVYLKWKDPEPALLIAALGIVVSAVLGLGYIEFVYAIAALGGLVFFLKMFFMPSGA